MSWQGISYLDVLRPEPGERLRCAFLATYGLDLVALGAAVVAAAGLGDENGRGTRLDFATAIEEVRGKFVVIAQRGRVAAPPERLPVLGILDQFVVQESNDERIDSWHPKIALVCHEDEHHHRRWRLWIGSRNLTRSRNWEAGLLLTSSPGGVAIQGVEGLAWTLADRGQLTGHPADSLLREVRELRWKAPPGIEVRGVNLYSSGEGDRWPTPDAHLRTIVVSPFVDPTTLAQIRKWESEERTLISTLPELLKLDAQARDGFDCYFLDEADFADANADAETHPEEQPPIGLHAKILAACRSDGAELWVGSANATQRAWGSRNAEVVAQLETDVTWTEGLEEFIARARSFRGVEEHEIEVDEPAERLERFRKELCASWDVVQRWENGTSTLRCQRAFELSDKDIAIYVSPVGTDRPTLWPHDEDEVEIVGVRESRVTELIRVRAELGADRIQWVMHAPLEAPPGVDRDRRAIAELLDVRAFLAWIRGLLEAGVHVETDIAGDEPVRSASRSSFVQRTHWVMPSLEDMLRTWARQPERLGLVDQRVRFYAQHMQSVSAKWSDEDRQAFDEFLGVWSTVTETLL